METNTKTTARMTPRGPLTKTLVAVWMGLTVWISVPCFHQEAG